MALLRTLAVVATALLAQVGASSCCGSDCGSYWYYPSAPSRAIACNFGPFPGSEPFILTTASTSVYCYSAHRMCQAAGEYTCTAPGQMIRVYGAIPVDVGDSMSWSIFYGTFSSSYPSFSLRTLSICNTNGCNYGSAMK